MKKQVKKNTKVNAKQVKPAKQVKKPEVEKPTVKPEVKKPTVKPEAEAKSDAAKRAEYAREYYKAHAEKIREASRKSHAKANALRREAGAKLAKIFDAVCGLVSETGAEEFDHFYSEGGEKMMNDFEDIVRALGGMRK